MEFFTIGVYNSTEKSFFGKLVENKIDTFCDIRQRRGVRGSKYLYANSNQLQERLSKLGINYEHVVDLATPVNVRALQEEADHQKGIARRDRQILGEAFKKEYQKKVLSKFDFKHFLETLENNGAKKVVLFCVEEKPEACHRSIVANKLANEFNYKVTHL
jgi:uncharacterized protein (DUF488 family)